MGRGLCSSKIECMTQPNHQNREVPKVNALVAHTTFTSTPGKEALNNNQNLRVPSFM